jgi:hypothetical protein
MTLALLVISPSALAQDNKADLLLVIQTDKAQLIQRKIAYFELIAPSNQVKSILSFSDRPDRIAFKLDFDEFLSLANHGSHGFNKIPPNIVISFGESGREAMAFATKRFEILNGMMHFYLVPIEAFKDNKLFSNYEGEIVVYIDAGDRFFSKTKLYTS